MIDSRWKRCTRTFSEICRHLEHGGLTAARAEKRKQFDRAKDDPIDVVNDQGLEIFGLVFIDRAMQRA
jgi:hypothetical protein